jgi:hypothetical protein
MPCAAFTVKDKKGRGQDGNTKEVKSKKTPCKKTGCIENKLMAQQVWETFTRYEKKAEYYLGMVRFSSCIIIYRKMVLGWASTQILN